MFKHFSFLSKALRGRQSLKPADTSRVAQEATVQTFHSSVTRSWKSIDAKHRLVKSAQTLLQEQAQLEQALHETQQQVIALTTENKTLSHSVQQLTDLTESLASELDAAYLQTANLEQSYKFHLCELTEELQTSKEKLVVCEQDKRTVLLQLSQAVAHSTQLSELYSQAQALVSAFRSFTQWTFAQATQSGFVEELTQRARGFEGTLARAIQLERVDLPQLPNPQEAESDLLAFMRCQALLIEEVVKEADL